MSPWRSLLPALFACGSPNIVPVPDAAPADATADIDRVDAGSMCQSAGTTSWSTYGHDAMRTSASDGCAVGPLTMTWSHAATPFTHNDPSYQVVGIDNAIVDATGVYVSSEQVKATGEHASIVEKTSPNGTLLWELSANHDLEGHSWPTVALGRLLIEDDWLVAVDATWNCTTVADCNACEYQPVGSCNNHIAQGSGFDDWGMSAADSSRFYTNSDVASPDGPGIYVGAWDPATMSSIWKQATVPSSCTTGPTETVGSIAVDGPTVFQAANYSAASGPSPLPSGIRSFNAADGKPGWVQPTTLLGAVSVGAGMLFVVEGSPAPSLVARHQSDGGVAWSTPLGASTASPQAPVQAGGLVIIAIANGVTAFRAATGGPVWSRPDLDAVASLYQTTTGWASCGGGGTSSFDAAVNTTLAAALGSNTLVVTAKDGLHVLYVDSGKDQWTGAVAGVTGPLKDPVISGSTVYAIDTSGAGKVVALGSAIQP